MYKKNKLKAIFCSIFALIFLVSCKESTENIDTKKDNNIKQTTSEQSTVEVNTNLVSIGVEEFKKELELGDYVLIDLRTTPELEQTGIISGAIQIDFYGESFKDDLDLLDRSKKYLIYCRSGSRSGNALGTMKDLGFIDVINLNSGINGWLSSNNKVSKYIK